MAVKPSTWKPPDKVHYAVVASWTKTCTRCGHSLTKETICKVSNDGNEQRVLQCPSCPDWKFD